MKQDRKTTIVIIEDNDQSREMAADFLQDRFPDAEVQKFGSGEEALEKIHIAPDVIITDYMLDSMNPVALNGLQLLTRFKEKYTTPVIFLSAQDRTDVSANIIKYGAYDYVIKNQDSFHRLEIIVKNALADQATRRQLEAQKSGQKALIVIIIAIVAAILFLKVL